MKPTTESRAVPFRPLIIAAAVAALLQPAVAAAPSRPGDDLLVVDCLLPGQVRKLGAGAMFLTARRPIKTAAADCEIRGGEYVAYDRANYKTALTIWLPLAQEGDPKAQTYVGEIFEKGLGTRPDYEAARLWYRRAAEQGFARASINLGFLYERGLGVPADPVAALNHYRKAAGIDGAIALDGGGETTAGSGDLERLRRELNEARRELDRAREANRIAEADRQDKERQLIAALGRDQPQAHALKAELAKREAEIERQREQARRLEDEAQQLRARLERTETEHRTEGSQVDATLARQQREITALYAKLDGARTELERARVEQEQTSGRLAAVLAEQRRLSGSQSAQGEQHRARIAALEAEIKARDGEVSNQRARVASVESELERQRAALATAESERRASDADRARTQTTLAQRNEEIERLRKTLEAVTRERDAAATARQRLENERAGLERDKQAAARSNDTERLRQLEAQLRQRDEEAARQRSELARIEQDLQRQREQLGQLQAQSREAVPSSRPASPKVAYAEPSIQLIDPSVVQARTGSNMVSVKAGISARDLVGKVTAPGGLLSLTINDRSQSVDGNGLFKTSVSLQAGQTPVNIIAIDRYGNKAVLDFLMSTGDATKANDAPAKPVVPPIEFGSYHALVIGNAQYKFLPKLDTSINDAKAVSQVLSEKFGFKVTTLLDATRYEILTELNKLRTTLTEKDNLLVYYGGHGELDRANLRGHWLPIDAEPSSDANWISNVAITDILNAMSVKHALVIADSCYSGAMTRSSIGRLASGMSDDARINWLKALAQARSRTVLTSGGVQPVADGGGGRHSLFAKSFLEVLNNLAETTEAQTLYHEVSARVLNASLRFKIEQRPEYAPLRFAGHESGDFLFVPVN